GVVIGDAPIDVLRARALNSIDQNNRYRGNDSAAPQEGKITASMFRLGNIRSLEDDVYNELYIDIPDSVIFDKYSNFDSIRLARVRVYDIFGNVITEVEQGFGGRGKIILGVHSRAHADPVDMAVFSVEFRNVFGWSKPVYWTGSSSGLWGVVSSWNGTPI